MQYHILPTSTNNMDTTYITHISAIICLILMLVKLSTLVSSHIIYRRTKDDPHYAICVCMLTASVTHYSFTVSYNLPSHETYFILSYIRLYVHSFHSSLHLHNELTFTLARNMFHLTLYVR